LTPVAAGYAIIAASARAPASPPMAKHPLYKEVKQKLTRSLIDGEWRPGEMLPSEPRLAERYGVGISTVRAAVRELEQAKVLMRAQGKGTFVLHFEDRESIHRYLNIARHDGAPERPNRTVLSVDRIDAPVDIAEALQLPRAGEGQKVFKLSTLVRLDGTPVYHSNVFLPARLFPRMRKSLLPDGNKSLYSIYQQQFNINVTKVVDALSTVPAPVIVIRLCNMRPGAWVLLLRRVSFTYDDLPVEVRHNWVNTTDHCYRIVQGDGV